MTPDQRRSLEEMASQYAKSTGWVPKLVTDKDYIEDPFMAGAQAGMDMATKAERERCAEFVERHAIRGDQHDICLIIGDAVRDGEHVPTPALRIDGTEERES